MKLTRIIYRQHIDRMFKKHWRVQGIRFPINTDADGVLKDKGIPIYDANEIIREVRKEYKFNIVGIRPKSIKFDHTHPNWHNQKCLFYRDNNVLLEGLNQAKILTKTVQVQKGLPEIFELQQNITKDLHNKVINIIKSSHIFDAEQEKLPKIKDQSRPALNFPRVYGITNDRINHLLVSRLVHLCEIVSDKKLAKQRTILKVCRFRVPLKCDDELIQFDLKADKMMLSSKPLNLISQQMQSSTENIELPDIHPIKSTITLIPENIYEFGNLYPLKQGVLNYHPHTIFVYYNPLIVKNLYEEEVTVTQILGRALLKSFTVAAAYARQKYGDDVLVLPKPVTLQCVQTDGKQFHFSIFQLNTLDFNEGGVKNIWYSDEILPLFESCGYHLGIPTVEGYNPKVISNMLSFYHNI